MPRRVRRNRKREPLPPWLGDALRTRTWPVLTDDTPDELRHEILEWKFFKLTAELDAARRELGIET